MHTRLLQKKDFNLTQETFANFLCWLDPDPDEAGRKYEDIRLRLIKIFICRGCTCPEDLADEAINRVIHKAKEIAASYEGNPALYFYGVANYVFLEYLRKKPVPPQTLQAEKQSPWDAEYECLEKCMDSLQPRSRELVLRYYQEEKLNKVDYRKKMAAQLGIPLNALRIRAFRIRMFLETCVQQCLQKRAAE